MPETRNYRGRHVYHDLDIVTSVNSHYQTHYTTLNATPSDFDTITIGSLFSSYMLSNPFVATAKGLESTSAYIQEGFEKKDFGAAVANVVDYIRLAGG